MGIEKKVWGLTGSGEQASKYILVNDNGMEVTLSDFSGSVLDVRLPVNGQMRSVVLGYDRLEEYYQQGPEFAGFVGRNGNRIAHGRVTLDGLCWELEKNNNGHNLHSGSKRSYYEFYQADLEMEEGCMWVEFSRISPHMEQGFPGNLQQKIRYTLTNGNELKISYRMVSDKTTVINPTNHTYFNLMGHDSGTILEHTMEIYADAFLPTDDGLIPTGEVRSVEGTPFDFRAPHTVGERIDADYEPLTQAGGYDHNYCFADDGMQKKVAEITSPDGAVTMTVYTDLCGMQVYAGNFLDGVKGKDGAVYHRRNGICFETQGWPNACNTPGFPRTVYAAGEVFESETVYKFGF